MIPDNKVNQAFLIRYFSCTDIAPHHDVLKSANTLRQEIGVKSYNRIANKAMTSLETGNILFGLWGKQKIVFVPK